MCNPTPKEKAMKFYGRYRHMYPKKSKDEIRDMAIDGAAEMMRIYFSNQRSKEFKEWESIKLEIEKL